MVINKKQNLNETEPNAPNDQKKHQSAWVQRQLWQILLTHIINKNQLKNERDDRGPINIH